MAPFPSRIRCRATPIRCRLPARTCRIGSLLQQISKAVCSHCYALRGRYLFPVVRKAMEKRLASLSHPRWVEAITTLIRRSGDAYFR